MTTLNTRDPVQGLVDYVLDVKPFHTKVLEVWVEYIYTDAIKGHINDAMKMVVDMTYDRRDKFCKYGFDTQPWNELVSGLELDEIITGTLTYDGNKTVSRAEAFKLYYAYMVAQWHWMNGSGDQPFILNNPATEFYLLSFSNIFNAGKQYFAERANQFEYWYEPASLKVYKRIGQDWHEQVAYVSTVHPPYPTENDLWLNTALDLLFIYLGDEWLEIFNVHFSYTAPKAPPRQPVDWMSNWDSPECLPPFGENVAYTYVEDKLEFTHGSEIFLSDRIRAMVYDPTGENSTLSPVPGLFTQRTEYPIKYRTTITQDPDGRMRINRQEVSILTEPTNPDILNSPYTIHLDGIEFEGFGLDRRRKGVRLNEYLVWRFKSEEEGVQLMADPIINRDTFGFRVDNGQLISQRITPGGRQDIDCPFNDGQVVYFTSNDDLPAYNLLTQDSRRSIPLMRYVPYRIVRIDARRFSVAILRVRDMYDPVTGQRIPSTDPGTVGYKTGASIYEVDTDLMGSAPYLNFVTEGHGELYYGIGHPIPFVELREVRGDSMTARFKDGLSSTTENFQGSKFVHVQDVLLGFDDHGVNRNAFVIEGNYPFAPGEQIRIANSRNALNDGEWTVTKSTVWSNAWVGVASNGDLIPSTPPTWWNELKMGEWPQPVKRPQKEIDQLIITGQYEDEYSEYYYQTFTTVAVGGTAPSIQFPHGAVVLSYYAFGEPALSPNAAATTVSDKIAFGQFKWVQVGGQLVQQREESVFGASVKLSDAINVMVQEGFASNEYGIPTIGSYEVHYYDMQSLDGGVVEE